MADALAAAGADIVGVSARIEESDAVATTVRSLGRDFTARAVNFADREAALRLGEELAELAPDILLNNAGTFERAPTIDNPLGGWDRVIAVDLSGQFAFTQLLARPMLERGSGKIVFTARLLSFQGGINVPGYTAAKFVIVGLTRALADEWMPLGANVNAIAPGYIATDNTQAL